MKKMVILSFLIFSTISIYGQERRTFETSEGYWSCQITYIGINKAREDVDQWSYSFRDTRLSNTQLDYLKRMLNLYETRRGETYYIQISFWSYYSNRNTPNSSVIVFVEFSSSTQFSYWAFDALNRL